MAKEISEDNESQRIVIFCRFTYHPYIPQDQLKKWQNELNESTVLLIGKWKWKLFL